MALILLASLSHAAGDVVDQVLHKVTRQKGLCAVFGGDGEFAMALVEKSSFLVYYRADSRRAADALVARPAAANVINERLYVDWGASASIPFADNAIDVLVLSKEQKLIPDCEVRRALNPGGVLVLIGTNGVEVNTSVKPFPPQMDQWSHWFHGPDNNPVSSDTVLTWPYLTQWIAGPHRGPQPAIGVVSHGRYFAAAGFNHGWGLGETKRMEHYRSLLTAFNAFNGTILWKRKLADNNPVARSGMIADSRVLLLMERDTVFVLDAETGRELKRILPHGAGVELKWMARDGDLLFVLGGSKDEELKTPAAWSTLTKYVVPMVDDKGVRHWGAANKLAAYDLAAGKQAWAVEEPAPIDARLISLGGSNLFYFVQDTRLVARTAASGTIVWENTRRDLITELTEPATRFGHTGLQVPRPGLLYAPDALLINTKGKKKLVAVSPSDGRQLWSLAVRNPPAHTFYFASNLYVDGVGIVDAVSGKTVGKFTCSGAGCGPIVASPNGFYGRHGIGFDLVRGLPIDDNASRGGCWQNCFPANGLLFMSPYLCGCPYILRGHIVVGSAGAFDFAGHMDPSTRLERVDESVTDTVSTTADDWPTYRANNDRSAATPVKMPLVARQRWLYANEQPALPTPPVAVGMHIYYGDARGMVYAINSSNGTAAWCYRTGGAIKAAPSVWQGRVFVGAGDGCVYALRAQDGVLLWRFRTGPAERRIMVFGQLVSTWPVNSGVLIHKGVAYFGAGIVDRDGTYVYALDAATGALRWQNTASGHLDRDMHKGASLNGYFTVAANRLWLASGNAFSPVGYDCATGATIVPGYASSSVYDPVRRGRDIGVFARDYVVHGGYPLFSDQDEWLTGGKGDKYAFAQLQADGTLKFPELELMTVALLPAWDQRTVISPYAEKRLHGVEGWCATQTLAFIRAQLAKTPAMAKEFTQPAHGKVPKVSYISTATDRRQNSAMPDYTMKLWRNPPLGYVYAVALADNAALVVWGPSNANGLPTAWTLTALSRADGTQCWQVPLPAEPLVNGLCVTRDGAVAITLFDGRLLYVSPPSTTSGASTK